MASFFLTPVFISCLLCTRVLCQVKFDICYGKADILFLLDGSANIGQENFQKQLQFVATFINGFQVGIAQFSVIRFDNTSNIIFDFDDYKANTDVKNAILQIAYPGGSRDTAAALRQAREEAFTSNRGARTGVPKIVIVSFVGQSNHPNETAIEAQKLKDARVVVLSIGVGTDYSQSELDTIASFPEYAFTVSDYTQLVSIVYDNSETNCREVHGIKCNNKTEIYFLLDSSSRISQPLYQKELGFVSNFNTSLDLADVIIGVATFGGSTVQKLFNLGQFNNHNQISQALSSGAYLGGVTDTDNALRFVTSQNVFKPVEGGRSDVTKILIVMTDGGSISAAQAKSTAVQLRATGVNILAVGVSNPNLAELKDLVNHPVLDVVTNLVNSRVVFDRVESIKAMRECSKPGNCEYFVECTADITLHIWRPEDLHFKTAIDVCDYAHVVDCQVNYNFFATG